MWLQIEIFYLFSIFISITDYVCILIDTIAFYDDYY